MLGLVCLGCESPSGILVSVTRDPASVAAVDELDFAVGAEAMPDVYWKTAANPDVTVDVRGRDLASRPYTLLFHDQPGSGAQAVTLMVAVIGRSGGVASSFGAFDQPQGFVPGVVLEREIVLTAGTEGDQFRSTPTGCLAFGSVQIRTPNDADCDGDPASTDCDDQDPTRSHLLPEVCGNGKDDNCDGQIDEGCGIIGVQDCPSACFAARGAPPCGFWSCSAAGACQITCPNCVDADGDGYGVGTGCAGLDCDDTNPAVTTRDTRPCGSAQALAGTGTCQAGTQTCSGGTWGLCIGAAEPTGEACNGQDDNCDGATDEGLGNVTCGIGACQRTVAACAGGKLSACVPGTPAANDSSCNGIDDNCNGAIDEDCACVHVATTGDDTQALADMNATPFATLQAAINYAATAARPKIVCVAAGATCGSSGTYSNVLVTMSNGIHVYGNYESTTWTRCTNSTTVLANMLPEGVVFPSTVTTTTVLDGFQIDRVSSAANATTTGVVVNGAQNAVLSNLVITNAAAAVDAYGILLINGGQALVTHSTVMAGAGTAHSVGIRATGSRVTIRDNCAQLDVSGRCTSFCVSGSIAPSIHGRAAYGPGESYAVLLDGSPGSSVEQSTLCGNAGDAGAALRVMGDGSGVVVRQNLITGSGGVADSHGVWLEDCGSAAPWVVDNQQISAAGPNPTTRVDGLRATGTCHPVIDSNQLIMGGAEGGTVSAVGVYCGVSPAGTTPSRCAILGNLSIQGSAGGFPPTAIGVRCEDGACWRIAQNTITGRQGADAYGLWLGQTGAFVDRNTISGGCPSLSATGVYSGSSYARLQNNRISGGNCSNGNTTSVKYFGLHAVTAPGLAEIDVHSNDLDAAGSQLSCVGAAIELEAGPTPPKSGVGVFRNNILRAGFCPTRYGFKEASHVSDPRILQNNDFDPFNAPTALYLDEGGVPLTSVAAINGLTDVAQLGANISVDPMYVAYPNDLHISAGSMCIGMGTPIGKPKYDFDGDLRKSTPDIGADEH
jgi:hypothetical protein